MNKLTIWLLLSVVLISGCARKDVQDMNKMTGEKIIVPEERIPLWNGEDFNGWYRYVESDSINVDSIWVVSGGVLHCTGAVNGYIRTENDYADYLLHVEWRWPAEAGNSGVLLHMQLPDKVWPECIEAQLKSGDAGDFYLINGTEIAEQQDKSSRRVGKMSESSENTPGEWNVYEITCRNDSIRLVVNGTVQNTASRASVKSGKICLQSEGKPIQFRNVYLDPLSKM